MAMTSDVVARALAQLTPDQRNVVLLRSVGHLSVAETAEVLHKRSGAVKTLHRRGIAALARVLDLDEPLRHFGQSLESNGRLLGGAVRPDKGLPRGPVRFASPFRGFCSGKVHKVDAGKQQYKNANNTK